MVHGSAAKYPYYAVSLNSQTDPPGAALYRGRSLMSTIALCLAAGGALRWADQWAREDNRQADVGHELGRSEMQSGRESTYGRGKCLEDRTHRSRGKTQEGPVRFIYSSFKKFTVKVTYVMQWYNRKISRQKKLMLDILTCICLCFLL